MEIEQLISDAETAGAKISLTADGKVRIDGAAAVVRDIARTLRPHRNTLIEYLKQTGGQSGAVVVRPPEGIVNEETIELEGDAEPSTPQFAVCPKCNESLFAPAPAIQVRNFAGWQHDGRVSYFWWTDAQLARLEEHLAANPGDVLMLPAYAHSVNIRRPDGSVYTHFRVK
jgi:hypothetical protein